ncbi:MAG: lipopolysaccharide transport periplasmic protein LptA [Gammaproteobacteria bacterium]|nr:lipopolysaccharide transport periplasmic protein LptA [Gammaproteobacteria bacterium]
MVISRLDALRRATLAALLLACAGVAVAQSTVREGDVTLDAASSEVDYRNNTLLFRDVTVAQGAIKVSAENARATGLDFADAKWTFTGRVRIEFDGGVLRSDEAAVSFVRNRITRADIRGRQAEFEQVIKDSRTTARGRAGTITYDVISGTVVLAEAAWLSDGRSEIRGEQLVYDVRAQRVQAGKPAGNDERVRITIRPKADTP